MTPSAGIGFFGSSTVLLFADSATYALGGMIGQYLSSLPLSMDPNQSATSKDREAVLDTLTYIWERGMAI